jgi:predicted MFS family arabinose efflux permease
MNGVPGVLTPERDAVAGVPASAARYGWVVVAVVVLASVAASLNQFKVPPLVPILMDAFGLGLSQAGLLMSVFGVTGVILALPAGLILQRLGVRATGVVAVSLVAAGAGWGALARDFVPLLASRVVEGAGLTLIAVAGPAAIALWFRRERQGAPMGVWATWVPLGNVAMYNLAPALATSAGWQAVWWAGAGFALIALLLYGWLMRSPPSQGGDHDLPPRAPTDEPVPGLGASLANGSIWLLALQFAILNVVLIGFYTYFPAFLTGERGYSLAGAAFVVSISTFAVLGSAPLAGWLSDRIGSRRLVIAIPFLIVAALLLLPFHLTSWPLYACLILVGLVSGATPTATFAAAPEVMRDPRLAGIGLGVVSLGMNLGMVIGPLLFGALVEAGGWAATGNWMALICAVGFAAAWLVKVR